MALFEWTTEHFEWTSAIETGHVEIDRQHQQLMRLAKAIVGPLLDAAKLDQVLAQLHALLHYTREHFAFEEGAMRSSGFPGAQQHAKDHSALLRELGAFCSDPRRREEVDPRGFIDFLWRWLALHIDSSDREFVAWLSGTGGRADGRNS